jgi:hypothetical protein
MSEMNGGSIGCMRLAAAFRRNEALLGRKAERDPNRC